MTTGWAAIRVTTKGDTEPRPARDAASPDNVAASTNGGHGHRTHHDQCDHDGRHNPVHLAHDARVVG